MRANQSGPLRLVGSLRGEGTLLWGSSGARPVTYSIDVYSQGQMRTGNGEVSGGLSNLVGRSPANVRLRLADGAEVGVALSEIEADRAMIELNGSPALPAD